MTATLPAGRHEIRGRQNGNEARVIGNSGDDRGRIDQAMGQVKQVIGKAVGNKELEQKGRKQESGGRIQSGHGDRKEEIEDSI